MTWTSTLFAAAILTTSAVAAPAEWRDEPSMAGTAYRGYAPPGEDLVVGGWRDDGGLSLRDDLVGIGFHSAGDRMAIATKSLTGRDEGGIPSWRIIGMKSVKLDPKTHFVSVACGKGQNFEDPTVAAKATNELLVAILPSEGSGEAEYVNDLVALARVNLVSGAITPMAVDKTYYCKMELP